MTSLITILVSAVATIAAFWYAIWSGIQRGREEAKIKARREDSAAADSIRMRVDAARRVQDDTDAGYRD